jgi:predicted RNA-binding Zn ribbon-like protein
VFRNLSKYILRVSLARGVKVLLSVNSRDCPSPPKTAFFFLADALCLDLVNTEVVANDQAIDLLPDFARFLDWLNRAGVVSEHEMREAARRWSDPAGEATLEAAKSLRLTIRRAAEAIATGKPVPDATLAVLNPLLARSPTRVELVRTKQKRVAKRFRLHLQAPIDLLAPIAESAADLFSSPDYFQIKKCANPACVLVFHDRTKNHRRRWCSAQGCGNRAKVAAYRERQRKAKCR